MLPRETRPVSNILKKPLINLYTVSPKERDAFSHVPWDPAHPLVKDCPKTLEYVRYKCNHEFYRTSLKQGWTSNTIKARLKRGVSYGRDLPFLCPRCWSNWSMQSVPFKPPRKIIKRQKTPLEQLKKPFIPRTVI